MDWPSEAEFRRDIAGNHGGHVGFPVLWSGLPPSFRIKRALIAGGHYAGNTDASGGAAVACRVREQPAVPTEPDEKSLPVTVLG